MHSAPSHRLEKNLYGPRTYRWNMPAGRNAYSTRKLSGGGFSERLLRARGHAFEVQPVESVNEIHQRKNQKGCFPTDGAARYRDDARDGRTHQVIGEGPQ